MVGHYKLKKPIGRGANATTYLAETDTGDIAVKRLLRTAGNYPEKLAHLREEVRVNHDLQSKTGFEHSNIIRVYELRRRLFFKGHDLLMEYFPGITLSYFSETKPHSTQDYSLSAVLYMRKVLEALRFMHNAGYIHGDVGSANILVRNSDLRLIDLGFAENIGNPLLRLRGTKKYSAPEQILVPLILDYGNLIDTSGMGDALKTHPRIDIFNLGRAMYEFLGGKVLSSFDSEGKGKVVTEMDVTQSIKKLSRFPSSLDDKVALSLDCQVPETSHKLLSVLEGCLIPNPLKRFQSADEVLAALDSIRI
ncbi:MAG: protein kinase [Nanoarchaeota archaeon]|nr:protein kinase [Nanoarchaeota archaeon]MBU1005153.1 protein kinase [Nanoarchaeota archaeon]MBU1946581.1 protein kinase [Nanoarchaeota archaeon]